MANEYPNRSDLRNPAKKIAKTAAKGQPYGQAGAQLASQAVVPMAPSPSAVMPSAPSAPPIQPGGLGAFSRPTERPNEPVTSGSSFGPGRTPGREFVVPVAGDSVLNELRGLYQAFPLPELADMLDSYVREGY